MPGDTQTGMERAEMKRFLLKSKQEPVNCALGVGDDKTVALLMLAASLRRVATGRSAEGISLRLQHPLRHRRGRYRRRSDARQVHAQQAGHQHGAPAGQDAEGHRLRKVQILLEDGTPVETAAEETGVGVATDGQVVEADARPDAGALQNELAVLVQRIKDVADPAMKARLAKLATDTNVNIKTNNLTYAATYPRSCATVSPPRKRRRTTMAGGGELVPPPPPPEAQAKPDPSALTAELTALVRRIPEVVAADPPRKETLATLARQAQVNLKTGNLTYAAADIECCGVPWRLARPFPVLPPLQAPRPAPRQASPSMTRHALPGWRRGTRSRAMSRRCAKPS